MSNVVVMDERLIGTDLEESGRDPREFLWRRHLPDKSTKKFSPEIGVYRVIQEESAILWEMIVCVILSKKFI